MYINVQIEDIALSFNFSIVLSDIVKDRWTDRHGSTLKLDLKVAAFLFSVRALGYIILLDYTVLTFIY